MKICGRAETDVHLVRVGGGYGGFWIPSDLLGKGNGLLVSGGIGFDVNFERAFVECGYEVIALDPLDECVAYAQKELPGPNVHLIHAGLWSRDDRVVFYAPRIKSHDSWSAVNVQETPSEEGVAFDVVSLVSVAREYPAVAERRPAVLKLNIEGAEAVVLRSLPESPFQFDVIAVHLESVSQVRLRSPIRFLKESRSAVVLFREMKTRGYRVARSKNLQICLLHESPASRGHRASRQSG